MMIDDTELREIFKISSEERLQALDEGLLHLEKHPDDRNTVAALMREAHSLKGDGNMLGVEDLGKVAHQLEHVLGAIARGEQSLSADLFDRLAQGVTALRQIAQEAVTGEPCGVQVTAAITKLMGAETAPAPVFPQGHDLDINDAIFTDDAIFDDVILEPLTPAASAVLAPPPPAPPATDRSDRYIADDELRDIFKASSIEHLQALDDGLLHLEKHPDDGAAIEALMRAAHTLKGDSTMLGVGDLGKLAHHIEHILGAVNRGEVAVDRDLGDRLSHGLAAMKQLAHEATVGEPTGVNVFYVLAELMGATLPATVETPRPGPESPAAAPAPPPTPHPSRTPPSSLPSSPTSAAPVAEPAVALAQVSDYRIETIRVPTTALDALMTDSGELTVAKTRLAHRLIDAEAIANLWEEWSRDLLLNRFLFHEVQQGKSVGAQLEAFHQRAEQRLETLGKLSDRLNSALSEDTDRLGRIAGRLEDNICTLRLLPLSAIFNQFPRLVRDLARQQGKQVELVIEGGDTRADKRILEEMKDPLLHMLLNAVDHGIELPEERRRQGKPPTATIVLRGYRTASTVVLEVCDDGRGLDLEAVKQTAVRRGLYRPGEIDQLSPAQVRGLILQPGFSTRTMVTEISGRGVGLDVLRTNVERLKGNIEVESSPGQGCTLRIQIGTTLATAHVLLVAAAGQTFALPVEAVETACLVQASDLFTLEGHSTILHGDRPVSVVWLAELLGLPAAAGQTTGSQGQRLSCIILQAGQDRLGLFVDALIDEQDVVLKPQSQLLRRVRHISGATILGTGEVCMVLNPQDLIGAIRQRSPRAPLPAAPLGRSSVLTAPRLRRILLVEDSIATRTQEKRILESAGYEVVTAVDGLDGFNKLQTRPFDAVVSDVQMPNLDGLGLTQRIRQHQEYHELPVVLVTTLASEEDLRRGAEAGANAYIPKGSFTQDILFETLDRLII